MEISELIKKHKDEIVSFVHLYKDYVTYENSKIKVKFQKDYRSELYLGMSVNDIHNDAEIYEITEKQ